MYKCCLFDLDGTLINTIHSLAYSISLTMEHFGYGPIDVAHTKKFVGDGFKKLVERALIYSGDDELTHFREALAFYEKTFEKNCLYMVEPYEGMPELLQFLKDKGIKIGVLTNKGHERAVECVEAVFGRGFFDLIIGEGNGVKCKPDPSGAFMAADHFHANPSQCLYFGDTNTDMKTGINAGMDTVAVTWGFRDRAELEAFQPKYIISNPSEIQHVFV
ncbi:HAD family hydrolase [Lacrimispora saccharolytica]|uniref:HAD-superfamily hydrolase, subfamily IA, variant 3 n=1 Tax=Lacrimispora saccharolytica (strain ATCC 35040 / DSM 2544 / NRCC 2533 / WM1) TaxID=610130 RepID=D9R4D7_LACSW|nr:HAD family hydrolase [Lacrimispora saccharolytica]ADL05007.1 HAD-superfamily hydrolase, subfamily IA, variant 3 [[Clostridium] saccharolyticum WM1]QRV20793.1 HAD family hydrolase [Lacrimispora saccharolytica]